ncbi:MAG TPA: hypothetical protein VEC37_08995 [Bacillota bacterium]|nr:hypothetical protein [Bacillota bacterium]
MRNNHVTYHGRVLPNRAKVLTLIRINHRDGSFGLDRGELVLRRQEVFAKVKKQEAKFDRKLVLIRGRILKRMGIQSKTRQKK